MSAHQRDHAPFHVAIASGAFQRSEDVRAYRNIGVSDCDGNLEDGPKCPPDVETLSFAANKDRHQLKVERRLPRVLSGRR